MIEIYNTLSRKREPFKPIKGKNVGIYVCGPTVYGPGHIGHARTYIAFDMVRRYLEYRGYRVKYVVNITDIHDDMIKRANELGITIFELADKNIKLFFKDMDALGIKKASVYPRVTKHIKDIIKTVQLLEKKGYAYETADGVYYDISKFKDYGKLSRLKIKEAKTGTRVETDKYDKAKITDFALWKKAKPNEPSWDSPWGKGRPGWHIECSVMSARYLGKQFDIHGGAVDLIFPHHENEIAQSEAAFGKKPFVKYWMHSGFLNVEGEKMSKSLANYIEIPKLLNDYDAKAFRFFIAGLHYKSKINFTPLSMIEAKNSLMKFNNLIQNLLDIKKGKENREVRKLIDKTGKGFTGAMDSDFNTPKAWAILFEFEKAVNKMLSKNNIGKKDAEQIIDFLKEINSVFAVFSFEKRKEKIPQEIKKLIEEREKYRKEERWAKADEIRKKIKEKGYWLDDTPEGAKVRKS